MYLLAVGLYNQIEWLLLLFPLTLIAFLAMATLMIGERVTKIILKPQRITIVISFGFWLKRHVHFKRW
ncbi:hypothetical protein [Candidatus Albibeggiatoa sp. nov. BB20]|uniref:hypothetical protein n=1 Tax=Candidatus Albibeggiatoa sp. nov. BB20 TaxID=3162723 RepID=UPI0033655EFA